jgi:phytoene desaturase
METNKTAIIAGAGIGGITTALFLARNGYKVDVYEKNDNPGGRCGQILRDGYRFDVGATMMLMPEVYRSIFKLLDLNLEKELDVRTMDDLYTIWFDDGSNLAFTTDEKRMEAQLESFEKGSFKRSQEYVAKGYELYQTGFRELIGRNFLRLFDFINLRNALLLIKLKTYISHSRYTRRFFSNKRLQMAYTFQNIYVGQTPFKAPALFSMIPAAELTEGSLFPIGGMYALVGKLIEHCKNAGVQFHYRKEVQKIVVRGNRAQGFAFTDGTAAEASVVIANADLPYVYRELLPPSFKSTRIEKMKFSCSALVFHWSVDKVYPQLGHHSIFLSDDFREGLDAIFKRKKIGRDPSFYVHAPVRTDPSAAPPGCDALTIAVGAAESHPKNKGEWESLQQNAREAVIGKLKSIGMTDIEEHIKFEIVTTPSAWESILNVSRGSVFGSLAHNIFQMGYFRPHNRDAKYRNLYFTGGSTHPGNGIPMVLLSAKLVAERILHDDKKGRKG